MRYWYFADPPDHYITIVSDEDIIRLYFPYWKKQMIKIGKPDEVTYANCIEDFVIVNWASSINTKELDFEI